MGLHVEHSQAPTKEEKKARQHNEECAATAARIGAIRTARSVPTSATQQSTAAHISAEHWNPPYRLTEKSTLTRLASFTDVKPRRIKEMHWQSGERHL